MRISSPFPSLVTALVVVLVLLSPTLVAGSGECTCRKGTRTFSDNSKIFRTAQAACDDAGSKCLQKTCKSGESCKKDPTCGYKEAFPVRITDNFGKRYSCGVECTGGAEKCTRKPGGMGDPHLTGFDGSRFDFHGEHGKYYTIFGRSNGDVLVTRMRSTHRISPKTGIKKTFFDQFGLKVGNSPHRITVSLVKEEKETGEWRPEVIVDGLAIDRTIDLGVARIVLERADKTVHIITAETKYTFHAKALGARLSNRHFDLDLALVKAPQKSDRYLGVLGFSLNKVIGHDIHPDLDVASREKTKLEFSLRNRFVVGSLFPALREESNSIAGVVRMAVHGELPNVPHLLRAQVNSS